MSKMKPDLVWYPPQFPAQGRLPTTSALVAQNSKQQDSQELNYHSELCKAADKRMEPPCCKTLHVSLFFDGTGNNLNNDLYIDNPAHPTNIARLFRATIGQGAAGGVKGHTDELVDLPDTAGNKYFKYYIPGVGTPFPEVSDLDYSTLGLAAAIYGEERINWGLLRLIDALRRTLGKPQLSDDQSWKAVKAMTPQLGTPGNRGSMLRMTEFQRQLQEIAPALWLATRQPEPGKPKLLGIKLYVYGFSRGAAAARAFINFLVELLPGAFRKDAKPELCLTLEQADWKVPLSVEFLGLLDTVASVGVAHIAPIAEGHMAWADGRMELPDNGLIKHCVHLIAAHEQRLCFPLDSICRHDGTYPSFAKEVVYPGMHSDIGGGYPPGDQGKATADNDGYLLSQIALHEMYAAAFQVGAPLKVHPNILENNLSLQMWKVMPPELQAEFEMNPSLISRFNAWRELTLNLPTLARSAGAYSAAKYNPVRASVNVIKAVEEQIGWITAWRIGRYANGSYKTQRFYIDSAANGMDKDSNPKVRAQSEKERDDLQRQVEKERKKELNAAKKGEYIAYAPGVKDFDPALGQTQLREAANEFSEDYRLAFRSQTGNFKYIGSKVFSDLIYTFSDDDNFAEYRKIKSEGNEKFHRLFLAPSACSIAQQPGDLVRSMFDDLVHDSRAWFLYSTFAQREPWGSYFLYRMIYFGELMSKNITPIVKFGRFVESVGQKFTPGTAILIERQRKGGGNGNEYIPYAITQNISIPGRQTINSVALAESYLSQSALTDEFFKPTSQQLYNIAIESLESKKSIISSLWP